MRDEKGQLDLVATIGQLRDALADLDVDERAAELQRLFGDEGLAGISPLMEQLSQLGAGFDAVSEAARRGLVDTEYQRFLESVPGQWKKFGNNVALVGETFAGTLLPALNAVLGPMTSAAAWVGSMIERFPALGYVVGGLAVGLAGLVTVAAAMWLGRTAALAFNVALLANPITWVVGALAGAAYLVYRYWEPIKTFFTGLWDGIEAGVAGVGDVVRRLGQTIVDALSEPREALDAVVGAVGKALDWLGIGDDDDDREVGSAIRGPARGRGPPARRNAVGAAVAGSLAVATPASGAGAPDRPAPPPSAPAAPAPSVFGADLPPLPSAPRGPTTVTVTVGDVVIEAPAGADPAAIAEAVRREMAVIMREAAIEAGLAEADDAY